MCRARASIKAMVCSAADTVFPVGAFTTTTPFLVAASPSILSTPVAALPITISRFLFLIHPAVRNAKRTCRCEPEGRGNLRKPCRAVASRFPSFGKLRTGCCPPCTSFGRTPRNDKRMVLLLPIPPHLDLLASSAILEISFSENKRHPRLSLGGE